MNTTAALPAVWVIAAAETRLLLREPTALLFVFALPPLLVVVLGGVFGNVPDEAFGGIAPTDYYAASYLGVVLASVALPALPVMIATHRELRVLRRFEAAGSSPLRIASAQALVTVLVAAAGCGVVLGVAALSYGVPGIADPLTVTIGFVAATTVITAIGMATGLAARTARAAQALGFTLFFPMYLLGGGGPPRGAMSAPMRTIADLLPLTHAIAAIQKPWLGLGPSTPHLLVLLAWLAAASAAITFFARRHHRM